MNGNEKEMKVYTERYALFDVDTRRLNEQVGGDWGLVLVEKAKVIEERLRRVMMWAKICGAREVISTCITTTQAMGGVEVRDGEGVWQLPVDGGVNVVEDLEGKRRFVVGRPCEGCREEKVEKRFYDVFAHHQSLAKLVEKIDADVWVVVGASFDFCLRVTAEGLVRLGQKVVVLEDVTLPSPRSTVESMQKTKDELSAIGVEWMGIDAFFEKIEAEVVQ
ncbi:isochorismatase family protein [Planctomycetota bacterium]|nr:isochorismatase family protein [Planctomycetota bacterium]